MLLQKGQKIKLADLSSLQKFDLVIELEMNVGQADLSCFGVDCNNKLSDDRYFIFYNQLCSPENAIVMQTSGSKATFRLELARIPTTIEKLVFTIASDDNTFMKDIRRGSMQLLAQQQCLARFDFDGSIFAAQKAIILAEVYQKSGLWRISTVADGFNGGLSALLAFFGGEEIAPQAPVEVKDSKVDPPVIKEVVQAVPTVVKLEKNNNTHKINLSKNSSPIHVNLYWNQQRPKGLFATGGGNIDLDLACMYRLKSGQQGVVQALGKAFGSDTMAPFIKLDQDDRTGSSTTGENMYFYKPELLDFVVVFAYIYDGVPNWQSTDAVITLKQQNNPDISISLEKTLSKKRFCVVAKMENVGGELEVKREEKYFDGHKEVDDQYKFNFRWVGARK